MVFLRIEEGYIVRVVRGKRSALSSKESEEKATSQRGSRGETKWTLKYSTHYYIKSAFKWILSALH